MGTVRNILSTKGSAIYTIEPEASVLEALRTMAEHNVGALVVTKHGELAGIFSERDYARKGALLGRAAAATTVGEIMTQNVFTVTEDHSVDACMALMTAQHIRHLPVVEGGKLLGMVSIGDIVKRLIAEREQTIQDLTSYITGTRS